jgi:hypothetical protein
MASHPSGRPATLRHASALKKQIPGRTWRHPSKPSLKVPYATATAMALMQMGVRDYATIAGAVALSVDQIRRIDMAEERPIRQLGLVGIPHGVYFKLHETIRCPKCNALVKIAPCVACDSMADVSLAECQDAG